LNSAQRQQRQQPIKPNNYVSLYVLAEWDLIGNLIISFHLSNPDYFVFLKKKPCHF